jgi:hemerythrin superfamily protein
MSAASSHKESTIPIKSPQTTTFHGALDMLVQDHRAVLKMAQDIKAEVNMEKKRQLVEQFIRMIVVHSMTEETQLYPRLDKLYTNGRADRERSVQEHKNLDTSLRELEKLDVTDSKFDTQFGHALGLLEGHMQEEERQVFPEVMRVMSLSELDKLHTDMMSVRKMVPTHPHPSASMEVRASTVAGGLVGLLDRTRDLFSHAAQNPLGV